MQAAPRASDEPPLQRNLPGPQPVAGAARAARCLVGGGPLAELPALAGCAGLGAADTRFWKRRGMACGSCSVVELVLLLVCHLTFRLSTGLIECQMGVLLVSCAPFLVGFLHLHCVTAGFKCVWGAGARSSPLTAAHAPDKKLKGSMTAEAGEAPIGTVDLNNIHNNTNCAGRWSGAA